MPTPPETARYLDLLPPEEKKILEEPSRWRWITSNIRSQVAPTAHPGHDAWSRIPGNLHRHAHREAFLVLSGDAYFHLNGHCYRIKPGMVVLLNSHEPHDDLQSTFHRGYRHLWLHFSNRYVLTSNLNQVDRSGHRVDLFLKFMSEGQARLLTEVWVEAFREGASRVQWSFLQSLISACFFEALSLREDGSAASPQESVIRSVCTYIEGHLGEELTVEKLAAIAGYSPFFFHRLFHRCIGKPLHQYVIEARVERAKALLREGYSVTDVSEAIGMVSPSYFSRFFRKHTRLTPSGWRTIHSIQK